MLLLLMSSLLSLSGQVVNHKCDVIKAPPWVVGHLPSNSDQVKYMVSYGDGASIHSSQYEALSELLFELGLERGVTISSETVLNTQNQIYKTESISSKEYSEKFSDNVTIKQDDFYVSIFKVDTYSETIKQKDGSMLYKVWQLYAIDSPYSKQISISYSKKYGIKEGWRSMIIPGWGQFYKGQYARGALFLTSEATTIGLTIYFQSRYNYNIKSSKETSILDKRLEYSKRAQKQILYRNISIGTIAGIWVWNVLDACLVDGRPRYLTEKIDFSFYPTMNNELMLGFTYKF